MGDDFIYRSQYLHNNFAALPHPHIAHSTEGAFCNIFHDERAQNEQEKTHPTQDHPRRLPGYINFHQKPMENHFRTQHFRNKLRARRLPDTLARVVPLQKLGFHRRRSELRAGRLVHFNYSFLPKA